MADARNCEFLCFNPACMRKGQTCCYRAVKWKMVGRASKAELAFAQPSFPLTLAGAFSEVRLMPQYSAEPSQAVGRAGVWGWQLLGTAEKKTWRNTEENLSSPFPIETAADLRLCDFFPLSISFIFSSLFLCCLDLTPLSLKYHHLVPPHI